VSPKAKKAEEEHPFEMTVDLSVVESLGINLYSNAAAVLTELVANAYDADAGTVTIDWKNGEGGAQQTLPESRLQKARERGEGLA
jgi:hypothetical protein